MANLEAFPFDISSGIKLLFLKSMARFFLVEKQYILLQVFINNISWNVPYLTAFSRKFSSMFDHLQIHSSFITILVHTSLEVPVGQKKELLIPPIWGHCGSTGD